MTVREQLFNDGKETDKIIHGEYTLDRGELYHLWMTHWWTGTLGSTFLSFKFCLYGIFAKNGFG